jgi:ATP-dependent RNA helicase DeaD
MQARGYSSEALHGDMKQNQRDFVMSKFKKGNIDILIATDVAARGIDVDNIEAVFNYDLPNDEEYYVHRIGRTGRAGKAGKAYTFIVGREIYKLKDIQRYTKSTAHLIKPPTLMDVEEKKMGMILNKLKDIIKDGNSSKYVDYIETTIEDINSANSDENFLSSLDVAAALLKIIAEQNTSNEGNQGTNTDNITEGSEDGMTRLFINIGRNFNIEPRHIVEGISSNTSLPGKLIGAIDIFDKFTFVEVPSNYTNEVISAMKNNKIKGKKINIETSISRGKSRKTR